ncbi:LCP family protein [Actinomyces bowdenii]|uniref:Transcriptional regulator n=1 Tax=Actinomyces bowdenii TaxID=131109 RepID=A0A3P1V3D3_9ACTO|nr:LCP family protein [Actinomyces bowdenii]RRD28601.1 transcriptional regulator [Actinomyces bowdenii]
MITNVPKIARPHARHSVKDLGRHAGRRVMLCLLAVTLFAASGLGFAWHDLQSRINSVDVDDILGGDRPGDDVPDSYEGRAVNLLVLGSDSRSGANNVDNSEGTEEGAGARSDTAMIMHVSADRKRIEVVSVPRDTLVDIPECTTLDGETTEASTDTQFNFAFSNGSNGGNDTKDVASGAACTQRTVEQMTGIRIDDFVVVDFNGLSTMVDSLGGVKVYVDEPIDDPDYTGLVLDEGCHTMDGATALQYSRVRHGVGNGSDISRIPRQQNLVGAMMRTAQSKNLLTNADQLYTFSASALETLTTSERIGKLQTLMGLASSVQSVGMENISFITMPHQEAEWDPDRVEPTAEADAVWKALRADKPVAEASVTSQADGSAPSQEATGGEQTESAEPEQEEPTAEEGQDSSATPSEDPSAAAAKAAAIQQCR